MTDDAGRDQTTPWDCAGCGLPLETASVPVEYLGRAYPVDMLRCPGCGLVMVPEDLALGKMADVEQLLEDK
jgi:hypothetical protein